ncbi:DUF2975 domain-containing protein [uncultured Polaribacter sp.]|uniref:DUF2975 domain-containing protein n=1 Tax=uncultured Polaribacter sp. TaxID=174711 RepID=UPI00260876C4|nr:DUF2975 domain-containing protein [uncultured Polaribacter sp.]
MKEILELKKSIKYLYTIFFVGIIVVYPIKALFAFMEDDLSYLSISNIEMYSSYWIWIIFLIKFIAILIFIIGVSYLIKTLKIKQINEIFNDEKIKLFHKSGKFFHYSAFVGTFKIWIDVINGTFSGLKLNNDFLFMLYFLMIIGFFLIIFSKILEKAKEIQQENDLTI